MVYNNLAFILATTRDDKLRDGKRAIALSNKAKMLQQKPSFDVLDTMAAAYAEAGEFDTAIKTQNEAIELAPEGQRENCGEILKLYESQRPRRESTSEKRTARVAGAAAQAARDRRIVGRKCVAVRTKRQ